MLFNSGVLGEKCITHDAIQKFPQSRDLQWAEHAKQSLSSAHSHEAPQITQSHKTHKYFNIYAYFAVNLKLGLPPNSSLTVCWQKEA